MNFKDTIRSILIFFHLDLTKNLEYDRLTKSIMKKYIRDGWNCVDIGCHKGEILDIMISCSPKGVHLAFEPIPQFYKNLQKKYTKGVKLYSCALSDKHGESSFQFVKNAPAYSGIQKRDYPTNNPDITEIKVELNRLDDLVATDFKIDLIKVDVEGGEMGVFRGGLETLKRNKPIVIFESGLGASNYYGTEPNELFDLLQDEIGLSLFTLKEFNQGGKSMSKEEYLTYFNSSNEYYFVAAPK